MNELVLYAGTAFMFFFAIMNPLANTPVFLGLTAEDDPDARKAVAAKALMLSLLIVAIFAVSGHYIFALFGITLPAFRITGGILVFQVGLHMLQGEQSNIHQPGEGGRRKKSGSTTQRGRFTSSRSHSRGSGNDCHRDEPRGEG